MKTYQLWAALCSAVCLTVGADAAPLTRVADLAPNLRPAGVPQDYVVTPNGFFHAACVVEVGDGDRIAANGDVQRADGSLRRSQACHHPHYTAQGEALFGDAKPARTGAETAGFDGWVSRSESDPWTAPAARKMLADFTVPQGPKQARSQVLYLFPGLEEGSADLITILQPVLAWNGFGDRAWTVTNWNCCKDGQVFHGSTIAAAPGNVVNTSMQGAQCAGNVCQNWTIKSRNSATGKATAFKTSGYGQFFNWYFGGVLEVYGVASCRQYPGNGSTTFNNIHVYGMNGSEITPSNWGTWVEGNAPACNYGVNATPNTTVLTWSTRR